MIVYRYIHALLGRHLYGIGCFNAFGLSKIKGNRVCQHKSLTSLTMSNDTWVLVCFNEDACVYVGLCLIVQLVPSVGYVPS